MSDTLLQPPLRQEPPTPLVASRLVDLLTGLVVTTTNLPTTLVRPRWQPQAPQQPTADTDWCAVGVVRRLASGYTHESMGFLPGTTTEALHQRRWTSLEALASFYGPSAEDLAELFRDAAQLGQNRAALQQKGVELTGMDEVLAVPDLVNTQWIDHQDVRFELVRQFDRYYPMQSILHGVGKLESDTGYSATVDSDQTPAAGGFVGFFKIGGSPVGGSG